MRFGFARALGRWRIVISAAVTCAALSAAAEPASLGYDASASRIAAELVRDGGSDGEGLVSFYRARGFAPLWTGSDRASRERLRVLHRALAQVEAHGLPAERFDQELLRGFLRQGIDQRSLAEAEVAISRLYLSLARALSSGTVDPKSVDGAMKRTVRSRTADELLALVDGPNPGSGFRKLAPVSVEYAALFREKHRLQAVVSAGERAISTARGTLRPGDAGPDVVALRERLTESGYLGRHLAATYDDDLRDAVRAFQSDMGLEADGIAGPDTIAALTVPASERLGAVVVAMERERWVSDPRDVGRVIVVNLPEFAARVFDDGREIFQTRAVVGATDDGKPTPEFSDEMTHMVINPSWYVPPGIIKRDYLPKLQSNPYALSEYEIRDRSGRPANRASGFRQYTAANFPFSIRQAPGPDNALGRVKFMFPNPWSIYLHDTPAKSLFDRDRRAYSSGCVRLADPFGFARLLLSAQEADPEAAFQSILQTGRERRVDLAVPVPVHLLYRTAFADAKGRVTFRADIYGRDAKVLDALERQGVALAPLRMADRGALAAGQDAG